MAKIVIDKADYIKCLSQCVSQAVPTLLYKVAKHARFDSYFSDEQEVNLGFQIDIVSHCYPGLCLLLAGSITTCCKLTRLHQFHMLNTLLIIAQRATCQPTLDCLRVHYMTRRSFGCRPINQTFFFVWCYTIPICKMCHSIIIHY